MLDRRQWRGAGLVGLAVVLACALAAGPPGLSAQTQAGTATRRATRLPSTFRIDVDGKAASYFTKFELIGEDVAVHEFQDGASAQQIRHKIPGALTARNLVLTKAIDETPKDLYQWWQQIEQGQNVRRTIAIVLLDNANREVRRWTVQEAWPCAWAVGLDAGGQPIETITFATEQIDIGI